MPKVTRINHIAMITDEIDGSIRFWRDALGIEVTHTEEAPAEGAKVAFLPVEGSQIELVEPTDPASGLAQYLEKRGPGMHHLCLEVDDIEGMLAHLKEKGVRLINETPRRGSGGKKYAFIHPKSAGGVLVELYEIPRDVRG